MKLPIDIQKKLYQYVYANVKHELLNKVPKDETCYTTRDKIDNVMNFCLEYQKNFKRGDNSCVLIVYEKKTNIPDCRSFRANYVHIFDSKIGGVRNLLSNKHIHCDLFPVWDNSTHVYSNPTHRPEISIVHTNINLPWMDQFPKICFSNMVNLGDGNFRLKTINQ